MGYPNSHHTPRSQHRSWLNCLNSLNIKGNINIKALLILISKLILILKHLETIPSKVQRQSKSYSITKTEQASGSRKLILGIP